MENKVIAFTGVNQLEIMDHSMPTPGPNEVVVHVRATALCTQEKRFYSGVKKVPFYPTVGGHESSGDVVAVGEGVTSMKPGDKVAFIGARPPISGRSTIPKNDKPDSDGFYRTIWGTLCKYTVRKEEELVVCNTDVAYEELALTEPVAAVLASVNKAKIEIGDTAVILGAGIMGMLHIQLAKMRGAYVIVSEIDESKFELAKKLGADMVINPNKQDLVAEVKKVTDDWGADAVFNTTPMTANYEAAFSVLGGRGKLICYSSQHPDEPFGVQMGVVHSKQYEIIGTVGSDSKELYVSAKLLSKHMLQVEELIDSVWKFEDAQDAFDRALTPNIYRVVIADGE